ncbi:MAG: T9SS type A sorting domain-containing protein [Bacteroidales bacterium]|nr:T9SS type A sorting domain-containing protein [Bacteroidales bacterium]
MKKIHTFLILSLFLSNNLIANVSPPQAYISEIRIDTTGTWTLELGFYSDFVASIDSIRLETSTGSALITQFDLIPGNGTGLWDFDSLALITNENLSAPLTLNTNSGYLNVISYSWSAATPDYVAFGSYPGSYLPEVPPTYSIAKIFFIQSAGWTSSFCLDASPTLGFSNDTTGCFATLQGMVYDVDGSVFTEGNFRFVLYNISIHIQPDGSYSERIFARQYYEDTIVIRFPTSPLTYVTYAIVPVDPWLLPDSTVTTDFITTSVIQSTPESEPAISSLVAFPNPFTSSITIFFPSENTSDRNRKISISTISGELVFDRIITSGESHVTWNPDQTIPPGIYIYRFKDSSGSSQTGKLIKLAP